MKDQRNNGEFHRADPAWRRTMQVLLAVVAVVGIACVVALHLWLSRIEPQMLAGKAGDYQQSLRLVMGGICLAFALTGAIFALWLFRLAAATRAERRWPPSTMRTSADVRIRYLTSADALVSQMKGGAIALALLALGLAAWGTWLLRSD